MPLAIYREVGDAAVVSRIYFLVGFGSMVAGLMVPWGTRFIPRRWMTTLGALLYLAGTGFALMGGPAGLTLALVSNAVATITLWVCLNAYLLDYFVRADIGRAESVRMFYSAGMWAAGPVAGIWLLDIWYPAPFLVAGCFSVAILAAFWRLRLGNGKEIRRARGPAANPLAYLGRFAAQPRLVAGWMFAVIRSCGWWVYVVYLPIFCIEAGLGDRLGGTLLSVTNGLLFLAPAILAWVQRTSVRGAVRLGFAWAALTFLAASVAPVPWMAVALVFAGGAALILLDVAGSLPFLMAVKPSERTEMAAVYSSYRDVSGFLTPGVAWLVLLVSPVAGVFAACGVAFAAAWGVASKVHPRLGTARSAAG
jgi:MFS family permease